MIYAAGGRSVPQNWTTAAKWWREAAEAGKGSAQRYMGVCYYYGRGVERGVAQAMVWMRKAAAQGNVAAVDALQSGVLGDQSVLEAIVRFTNAGSAAPRHAAAHEFAEQLNEGFLVSLLQGCSESLRESDSGVPHLSLRDSFWVEFVLYLGISDEELELAKNVYAYSKRTCTFCGSNAAPLRKCSLCMELRYCIGTDCQHADWNKTPAAESHKML
jgi:TPR repeat protein